jgi:hypothetical protein
MSWSRDILPVPIAAMFNLLLGAFFPKTDAGRIEGKPKVATPVAMPVFTADETNFLRFIFMIGNFKFIILWACPFQ